MTVYAGHLEVMTISTLITVLVAGAVYEIYKRIAFVFMVQTLKNSLTDKTEFD